MKVYDISQEVFTCAVYPGDPSPERFVMLQQSEGAMCNLTAFKMCAHNGTHVDAPYHFISEGKKIDEVDMQRFVGYAYVAAHEGDLTAEDAKAILDKTKEAVEASGIQECDAYRRILIKGDMTVTEEAAKVLTTSITQPNLAILILLILNWKVQ